MDAHKQQPPTCVQDLSNPVLRMLSYRWYPSAMLMADGRQLISSGIDYDSNNGCATTSCMVPAGRRQRSACAGSSAADESGRVREGEMGLLHLQRVLLACMLKPSCCRKPVLACSSHASMVAGGVYGLKSHSQNKASAYIQGRLPPKCFPYISIYHTA